MISNLYSNEKFHISISGYSVQRLTDFHRAEQTLQEAVQIDLVLLMYVEAMASPYSKEWENAQHDEVKQLEDTVTIKWINKKDVLEDQSLIESCMFWKMV